MNSSLLEILEKISSKDDSDSFTHVTFFPKEQTWTIGPNEKLDFWEGYCKLLNTKGKNKDLCVAERNTLIMPLILDFNFRFDPDKIPDEPVSSECLLKIVSCIQQVIITSLEISEEEAELYALVFLSDRNYIEVSADDSKILCRSIRIQFPYCRIEAKVASQFLFPEIIRTFRQKNIFKMFERQPLDDWQKILDLTVLEKPVLLFGSVYNPGEPTKKLQYIWGKITREHADGQDQPPSFEPKEIFDFEHHQDIISGFIDIDDLKIEYDEDYDYFFPILTSINYSNGVLKIKNAVKKPTVTLNILGGKNIEEEGLDLCSRFLKMLSPNRFQENHTCMDIGRALYAECDGSEEGYKLWKQYGKIKIDYEDAYFSFYDSKITVKTLAWYAKEDNLKVYTEWHNSIIKKYLEESLDGIDNKIAQAFYKTYWLDYIFVPVGRSGQWYEFKQHKWRRADLSVEIRKVMSNKFTKKYDELQADLSQQKLKTNDENTKGRLQGKIDQIVKIIDKLGKYGTKCTVVKNASEFFCEPKFGVYLDQNPHCMGFNNCVSETCLTEVVFRNGKPEDYISKSTGVKIDFDMDWDHPLVKKTMKWFSQVFVDKELRDYFIKYGASWFIGLNPDKIIAFWTGAKHNSKSGVVKGFESAFGDYCFKIPNGVLTNSNKGSGPNPELAQANGSRGGFSDELEEEEVLKTGVLKRWSGGDSFFARRCNEDGGKIKSSFKINLVTNKLPRMNSVHGSIKDRVVIFPFLSTWSFDAPDDEEEQYKLKLFKRDKFFENQIPKLAPAIAWIFAKKYRDYITEGLPMPKLVKKYTDDYWADIDMYTLFKNEYVGVAYKEEDGKKVQDEHAKITVSELYAEFKPWFRVNYEGEKVPSSRDFKLEMIKYFGIPSEAKYWYGLCITTRKPVNLN